jgi:integrase/recombinase XerD
MSAEKSARRRKAPKNTEWRGDTLHGRIRIKGKLHRWSLRTGDVKLAAQLVEEDIERLKASAYHDGPRIKWLDLAASWAERHILHEVGPRTAERYATSLEQLKPLMPEHVDEITKATIGKIVDARRAAGRSNATINRDLTAVKSVLDFGEVEDNPVGVYLHPGGRKKSKLKERRDPIILPELPHVERVVARATPMLGAIATASLLTGCRQDELVTAERTRIDHAHKNLTLIGKGNKLRVISLNAAAYAFLCSVPPRLGCKWLFWSEQTDGRGKVTVGPLLNVASRFYKLVKSEVRAAQKTADKAGGEVEFRRFTFHHLRHRYAVDYLRHREGSIYDLQQQLGHTSVTTTEMYLKFLTPEEARAAKFGAPPAAAAVQKGA